MPKVVKNIEINGNKLKCVQCREEKDIKRGYYKSKDPRFGISQDRCYWCKECLEKKCFDANGIPNRDSFREILRDYLNLPFDQSLYEESLNKDKRLLGYYITQLNTRSRYKGKNLTWEDGQIEDKKDSIQTNNFKIDIDELNMLKDKYGFGYSDDEYYLFEKKYQQLRPSIQLLTTMHDEFFREYCIDKVKETLAKARGDFKEAKEWASMAKDASTAGKLNPSQMSKSDLTGGLDTFGQLSRMIEQTPKGEILKILPKFIEKPKDKVDIVLWLHINGIRDIKGLPPCEYKDIYKFYEEKRESYERQMLDNKENSEGDENGEL